MAQPKRIPGETNPSPNADAPMHVARESWMSNGHGDGAPGITRAVVAILAWRRQRKARKAREAR